MAGLLGPADGRYLSRAAPDTEPELVLVLTTLGAPRGRPRRRRRRPRSVGDLGPDAVPVTRASAVRADPLGSEAEADEWLAALRRDPAALAAEVERGTRELNRLMRAHRAAAFDPHAADLSPDRALAVRVGHGSGTEVAEGRYAAAVEAPPPRGPRRRIDRLSPQERLAELIGVRTPTLAADELVLRARSDLEAGRTREAALQARIALECVLEEVPTAHLGDLRGELEADRDPVGRAAAEAVAAALPDELAAPVDGAVARMERALRRHRAQAS